MALTHGQGRLGLLGLEIGDREQEFDNNGWAHVHHAAFNGYQKSVLRFVNTKPDRLEILTEDGQGLTPFLIACVSGQKEIIETLIDLGANVNAVDRKMLGAVELSSLNENTHLLEFFIEANIGINVFSILFQCLSGKHNNADLEMAACKSIHLLSRNSAFCEKIVENSGIKSLLDYLKSTIAIDSSKDTCLEILLNIFKTCSVHDQVLRNGGIEILIDNLKLANEPSIYLKAVKILGMLAMHAGKDIKYKIDDLSGITSIVTILKSAKENGPLVLECLATLIVLITDDKKMQTSFCTKAACMKVLIDLMSESTDPRQNVATLRVIVATVSDNKQAQAMFAELNGFKALSLMLKSKSSDCVISAVIAVERLAKKNEQNQDILLKQGIINVLIKILKKSRHVEGKAATAGALWAIAGDKFHQQRAIATLMGTGVCIEFLGSSVPSQLHFYGSEGIQTLTKGVGREIDEIANAGGIQRILHILGNATTPSYVALSILKSLRCLCIAPGYAPHIVNQKMCMNEGAVRIIINYAKNARTEKEQAESYYTLGAIAYGNKENVSIITKTTDFSYIDVLTLLYSNNIHVKEISGSALALFAFNSQKQLKEIAYSGGIPTNILFLS
ncbi:ankyrin and armadillo repeat-containing protein-like [Rhopilema esculentum]|uniref:ankyrin and armadillo repeat-containing protein-like n=1 Tax=Rhopilema esculentum TaxID=499914 RepID=UPI0031D34ACB